LFSELSCADFKPDGTYQGLKVKVDQSGSKLQAFPILRPEVNDQREMDFPHKNLGSVLQVLERDFQHGSE
jgi:hypothetical protein